MAKHHIREREPGWRVGLFVNGTGAVLSLVVDLVIAYFKFPEGAWVIVVLVPIMVYVLVRLNRQYESEAVELEGLDPARPSGCRDVDDGPRAAEVIALGVADEGHPEAHPLAREEAAGPFQDQALRQARRLARIGLLGGVELGHHRVGDPGAEALRRQ